MRRTGQLHNWKLFFGLLITLGGGSAFTFKMPGAIDIVKSILSIPEDYKIKKAEASQKELELLEKKLDVYEKIKDSGIDPETLNQPLEKLVKGASSLQVEPIILDDVSATTLPPEDAITEFRDIEDE